MLYDTVSHVLTVPLMFPDYVRLLYVNHPHIFLVLESKN